MKCWGRGVNGRLGYDSSASNGVGSNAVANLATVNIGVGKTAIAIGCGQATTCVLLNDGTVKVSKAAVEKARGERPPSLMVPCSLPRLFASAGAEIPTARSVTAPPQCETRPSLWTSVEPPTSSRARATVAMWSSHRGS